MLFSSQPFILIFLPIALWLYYAAKHSYHAKLLALFTASTVFYAWWDPRFVPLLLGTVGLNWFLAKLYFKQGHKFYLVLGVAVNLSVLGLFKYANFLAEAVLNLVGVSHEPWSIILPLGISFFTFQQISYLVDVKRGEAGEYQLLEYATYVSFFPQLIAGPIVRHGELIPQFKLAPNTRVNAELVGRGVVLFALGLVKKVFFADELAPVANEGFATAAIISAGDAWTSAIAYSLQLYFDFSSYSDMAIGLGGMFGFRLPINFDSPYKALDIRDFWRRWHITLSSFLRDYVYIPLGGSRGGPWLTCGIVMVTMLLCGLWHGAGWTFIAWGALHGGAICANRIWIGFGLKLPAMLGWTITMLFVVLGWVLFRAENFTDASNMIEAMMWLQALVPDKFDAEDWTLLGIGLSFAIIGPTNVDLVKKAWIRKRAVAIASGIVLTLVCLRVGQGRGLEFIYFQF